MPTIPTRSVRLLDPHTVNQIAAGEVVERPASAVKELVENALDAGATRIVVELLEAGTKLIRVADDGCGMTPADAVSALQRHATSKIQSVEDLQRVSSLGFRGEALPSIASVSLFRLSTGTGDGTRVVLKVSGGKEAEPQFESGPSGTTVTVEDLFFNTPARLKFLKTQATELGQITEILGKYAISLPSVAFKLIHGVHTILDSPGDGDPLTAIASVWGRDVARALAPVSSYREGIRVRGFISAPHFTRPTRSQQWVFVNGRPVKNRSLYAAIDNAYRQITPEKRYPVALIQIDVDPARVDMNVSPTKSECRFSQEGPIFDAVRHSIKDALLAHGMMPSLESVIRANQAIREPQQTSFGLTGPMHSVEAGGGGGLLGVAGGGSEGAFVAPLVGRAGSDPAVYGEQGPVVDRQAGEDVFLGELPRLSFADRFLNGLRVIGQTGDAFFIIAENDEGIMVIDQHVAHERVLFERIRAARGLGAVEKQPLLTPLPLELDRRQAELLQERLNEFVTMGFDLEPFGAQSYLIRSVPAALRREDPLQVVRDLVDEILEGSGATGLSPREEIWVMCSCKMAIKAGDKLGFAEMEKLLFDLAKTENPYLCPHGRPITITLGRNELLRRFKRA